MMEKFEGYDRVKDTATTINNVPCFNTETALLAQIAISLALIADILTDEHNEKLKEEK